LREEHFQTVLRKIFQFESDKLSGKWRKLHRKEHYTVLLVLLGWLQIHQRYYNGMDIQHTHKKQEIHTEFWCQIYWKVRTWKIQAKIAE